MTLLVIEHDMDVAFELTDRITVLHYGKVVADGFSHEVKSNPLVQEIYLWRRSGRRVMHGETHYDAMLEIRDIHTYYGDSHILQGISLSMERGQVVGILGRKRNGKNHVSSLYHRLHAAAPRSRALLRSATSPRGPRTVVVTLGLGLVPQGRRVFPSLTVLENLLVANKSNGGRWTVERVMELFPRLRERRGNRAGKLSGGEQQNAGDRSRPHDQP